MLYPVTDEDGLMRIGGWYIVSWHFLRRETPPHHPWEPSHCYLTGKTLPQKSPPLLPSLFRRCSPVSWIGTGSKRLVSSVIHKCVLCKKLRGKMKEHKMSDLPADTLISDTPFTRIRLGVLWLWTITSRRTRGGHTKSKCCVVMFTCLSTRAVHIDVIQPMMTSSFFGWSVGEDVKSRSLHPGYHAAQSGLQSPLIWGPDHTHGH